MAFNLAMVRNLVTIVAEPGPSVEAVVRQIEAEAQRYAREYALGEGVSLVRGNREVFREAIEEIRGEIRGLRRSDGRSESDPQPPQDGDGLHRGDDAPARGCPPRGGREVETPEGALPLRPQEGGGVQGEVGADLPHIARAARGGGAA